MGVECFGRSNVCGSIINRATSNTCPERMLAFKWLGEGKGRERKEERKWRGEREGKGKGMKRKKERKGSGEREG